MWQVLSARPFTERTGEKAYVADTRGEPTILHWERVKDWPILGTASSYEEARRRFGGRPVLAWIGNTH